MATTKLIGFDADEPHRAKPYEGNRYPLIEWGWGRAECIEAIDRAGVTQPGKSACFFCPSSKKKEIYELRRQYPALAARAVAMELNAIVSSLVVCPTCKGAGVVNETSTLGWLIHDGGGDDEEEVTITKHDPPITCPKCLGKGEINRGVKGLGRSFAWGDLYAADDAQEKLFPESPIEIDCGCYDGAA